MTTPTTTTTTPPSPTGEVGNVIYEYIGPTIEQPEQSEGGQKGGEDRKDNRGGNRGSGSSGSGVESGSGQNSGSGSSSSDREGSTSTGSGGQTVEQVRGTGDYTTGQGDESAAEEFRISGDEKGRVQEFTEPVRVSNAVIEDHFNAASRHAETASKWVRTHKPDPVNLTVNLPATLENSFTRKNNIEFVDGGSNTDSDSWTGTIASAVGQTYELPRVNFAAVDASIAAREAEMRAAADMLGLEGASLSGGSARAYQSNKTTKSADEASEKVTSLGEAIVGVYAAGGQEWLKDLATSTERVSSMMSRLGDDMNKLANQANRMNEATNPSVQNMVTMTGDYKREIAEAKAQIKEYNARANEFNAKVMSGALKGPEAEGARPRLSVKPITQHPLYADVLTSPIETASAAPGTMATIAREFVDRHTGKTIFEVPEAGEVEKKENPLGEPKTTTSSGPSGGGGGGGGPVYSGGGGGGGTYSGGGGSFGPSRATGRKTKREKKSKDEKLKEAADKIAAILNGEDPAKVLEKEKEDTKRERGNGDVEAVPPTTGTFTSGYGPRWGTMHDGIDIANPIGTPIVAPVEGEVIASGPAQGFGQWVRLKHPDGSISSYGHVSARYVNVGDYVNPGDHIADIGNEGQSTGPHLHLRIEDANGASVDPMNWLDAYGINEWRG